MSDNTIGVLFLVLLTFSSLRSAEAAPKPPDILTCQERLAPIISEDMLGYWSTLDAQEQEALMQDFERFWTHHLSREEVPLEESQSRFANILGYELIGTLDRQPKTWDPKWLDQILRELEVQPDSTSQTKEALQKLRAIIKATKVRR